MSNQLKGYQYEIQIRDYIINTLNKPAYLWTDTPETILIQNNIIGSHNINRLKRKEHKINPLQDTGIDIIQLEENKCSLVQCKNGYKKGLKMEDLAGFNAWMSALDTLSGYVYYTDKLSQNIISLPKNKRIEYIKQPFQQNIIKENISEYQPYDYQTEALNKFIAHFEINNRGILSMPCGTGKTYTSYIISEQYSQIIMISPLREFAKQNLNRYIEYGYKNNALLVSSDGLRDIEEIKKFIQSNNKFLISSTFCSIDCIRQILEYCNNPLIIIDEFHNLSKNNIISEEDDFYNILNANHKIMFMSATPRVYELEDELYDPEYIFGIVFYNMSFTEAINKKYITDYKIWLPSIHEDNSKLEEELSIYEIDNAIKAKCNFFFSCLLNNGSKKCIIYCMDTNEITNMIDAMNKLNDYFCLDYKTNQITASNTNKQREDILSEFTTSNNIYLLFSIRILDECIDIPSCDSIFITYPTKSKIRTIQRLSRCIRTNKLNPYKIGNIYIWTDEYDKILDTLSGIKEYDMFFKDKIKLNIVGFYDNDIKEGVKKDNKLIENYIIGVKEFRFISWADKLDMVKKYIDTYNERPKSDSVCINIKTIGLWLNRQNKNYKLKTHNMANIRIYDVWTDLLNDNKYKEFISCNEDIWNIQFNKLKKYIDDNNNIPSQNDPDKQIKKLGIWFTNNKSNFKNKKNIMENEEYYQMWNNFITDNKYYKYFISDNTKFIQHIIDVKKYIELNKKKPTDCKVNKVQNHLSHWLGNQNQKYKNNKMKKEEKELWHEFINDYNTYFLTEEQIWMNNFNETKKYIDVNNVRPTKESDNVEIKKMGMWLSHTLQIYKKKTGVMKTTEIYDTFVNFTNDNNYKKYFTNDDELWFCSFEGLKSYINNHNDIPKRTSKDNKIKILAEWLHRQRDNYKNVWKNDDDKYNIWKIFVSDEKYKEFFKSNEEKWFSNFEKIKQYINFNNKMPSQKDKNNNIKSLGYWLSDTKINYKNKTLSMTNNHIYDQWTEFVNDPQYKLYFKQ